MPDYWNSSFLRLIQRSIDRLQRIESTAETILRKILIPFDVIRLAFNGVLLPVESILSFTGTGLSGNFCSADVSHFCPGHAGGRWHLSVSACVHTKQVASSLQTRCKFDSLVFQLVGFPFTKSNLKLILKLQTKVMCAEERLIRWLGGQEQKKPFNFYRSQHHGASTCCFSSHLELERISADVRGCHLVTYGWTRALINNTWCLQ